MIAPEDLFPDNWIYIHDRQVQGRPRPELQLVVARDGARSEDSPASASSTSASKATASGPCADDDLVALATRELARLGLATPGEVDRRRTSSVRRRPTRSTTSDYAANVAAMRARARGRATRRCTWSAATACTATTTRTTR